MTASNAATTRQTQPAHRYQLTRRDVTRLDLRNMKIPSNRTTARFAAKSGSWSMRAIPFTRKNRACIRLSFGG